MAKLQPGKCADIYLKSYLYKKSPVLLHYINNLINRANTYHTGVSKAIEQANLLLIL